MAEPNPDSAQPPGSPPATIPPAVNPGHPGHDSALSLAATIVPDSSTEAGDHDDMASFADEEDIDMHGGFDDNDSAFGGSLIGCDTDTLASYITDYRYENGRRYHAYRDGEYWVDFPILHLLILRYHADMC
jgi:hypothetical protein